MRLVVPTIQNTGGPQKRVNIAYSRKWPRYKPKGETGPVAICAAGPSLQSQLPTLRKLVADGVPVCAVKGVEKYLREHGIPVKYAVFMDAKPDQVRFVTEPSKDTTYLLASQCDPSLFDALDGYDIQVWNGSDPEFHEPGEDYITGGGTTGIRAINLMRWTGYKGLHLFGFDCCLIGDESHVYAKDQIGDRITVYVNGKKFITTGELAAQHQQMLECLYLPPFRPAICVHGDGALYESTKEFLKERPNLDNIFMQMNAEDVPKGGKVFHSADEVKKFLKENEDEQVFANEVRKLLGAA